MVVDAALKYGRPFAVVPCCVFANFFPHRARVDTHRAFCKFLQSKSDDIQVPVSMLCRLMAFVTPLSFGAQVAFLPFQGKNKVIYRPGVALPQVGLILQPPMLTVTKSQHSSRMDNLTSHATAEKAPMAVTAVSHCYAVRSKLQVVIVESGGIEMGSSLSCGPHEAASCIRVQLILHLATPPCATRLPL